MSEITRRVTRRGALSLTTALLAAFTFPVRANSPRILVHKNPSCNCCSRWVRHLEQAGFAVTADETEDLQSVRRKLGVPADLSACHTAEIDGYVLEGHVPAVAVRRLLAERPTATGLAVPGMPFGSPGMDGGIPKPYAVFLFGTTERQTFMRFVGANPVS